MRCRVLGVGFRYQEPHGEGQLRRTDGLNRKSFRSGTAPSTAPRQVGSETLPRLVCLLVRRSEYPY